MALRDNLREKWFKNNSRRIRDRDVKFARGRDKGEKWAPTNMNEQNGKGSAPRNKNISSEEEDLRWKLAFGKISQEEFDKGMEELNGE